LEGLPMAVSRKNEHKLKEQRRGEVMPAEII
jgi:hypothetical protein